MILFLIFAFIFLAFSISIGYMFGEHHPLHFASVEGVGVGVALTGLIFVVSQMYGNIVNTHRIPQHTETKIVSLQDGSQIEGTITGGLFVIRGQIGETEYFSYYKDNGDGSYSIDKQLASLSVIVPDATPQTAHLSSESVLEHCDKKWWSTLCGADSGIYTHGVLHVPPDSITNNFTLDAK